MPNINELVADLGSGDAVKAYRARQALAQQTAAAGAAGNEAARALVAAALANALAATQESRDRRGQTTDVSMHDAATRSELARQLSLVVGESELPVLEKALADFDVREAARFALERCPLAAATDILCKAATDAVGVEFRVGVINALGKRNGSNVLAALKKCLRDAEPQVRLAAAEALATQTDPDLDKNLANLRAGRGVQRGQRRLARARLRLAESVARSGNQAGAKSIYTALAAEGTPEPQRRAAETALKQLG